MKGKSAKVSPPPRAIQVVREKGVEIQPLREILRKMGETSFRDDDTPKRCDEKADAMIKLRPETASRRQQGPAELASFAQKVEALIARGNLDRARASFRAGGATAHAQG
jgi:hypothetical protein